MSVKGRKSAMDDRKRRLSSPVPAGGNSAQKRKMMALDSSTTDSPSRTTPNAESQPEQAGSLDAKLGLDEGFLEVRTAIINQYKEQ